MKICIVTGATYRRFKSHRNHEIYAKKHSYDLRVDYGIYPNLKNVTFFKVSAIAAALPHYDWIFWLDDDAFITDFEKKLEVFIRVLDKNKIIGIGKSPVNREGQWTFLNAGAFFLRNCPKSFDLLRLIQEMPSKKIQAWWNSRRLGMSIPHSEQDALIYVLLEHCQEQDVRYFDSRDFNARPYHYRQLLTDYFIVHFAITGDKTKAIAEFGKRFGLDESLVPRHLESALESL